MTDTEKASGRVYVLQAPGGGPIKIGFTTRTVEARRDEISKHWPCTLKILNVWEGCVSDEKEIHRFLAHSRIEGTEWFALTGSVVTWLMKSGCTGWAKCEDMFLEADYVALQAERREMAYLGDRIRDMGREIKTRLAAIEGMKNSEGRERDGYGYRNGLGL